MQLENISFFLDQVFGFASDIQQILIAKIHEEISEFIKQTRNFHT